LVLWFGTASLVLMLGFGYWQQAQQREFIHDATIERAVAIAHEIAVSSVSWALAGDLAGLEEIVKGFESARDMQRAYFVDLSGKVLASTEPAAIGLYVNDAADLNMLKEQTRDDFIVADQSNLISVAHTVSANTRQVGWVRVDMTRDSANTIVAALTNSWINFTLAAVITALAISIFLSRRITSGLNQLMEVAKEVTEGQEHHRARISENDEIGVLADHLNKMLDKLALQKSEIIAMSQNLRESQESFQRLLNTMSEGVYEVDTDGNCVFVNQSFLTILGYQDETEIIGKHIHELIHHHRADGSIYPASECKMYRSYEDQRDVHVWDEVFWRKDGTAIPVEYWAHRMKKDGRVIGAIATFIDISERKRAEALLRESELRMREIVNNAPFGAHLYELMPDGALIFIGANAAADEILGVDNQQFLGKTIEDAFPPLVNTEIPSAYRRVAARGGNFDTNQIIYDDDKISNVFEVHAFQTGTNHMAAFFLDVTERNRHEKHIQEMAFHDELTKLPNRRLLEERLVQAMVASKRNGKYCALLFLDLDNFKPLNDAYGHDVGDLLLIEVAIRITGCIRAVDTVSRFGGDEFVVLLTELDEGRMKSIEQVEKIANKIRITLAKPYFLRVDRNIDQYEHVEHHCTSSIGATLFLGHEFGRDEIIRKADTAMYQAKEDGRNLIRFLIE
jgi:diguanylate cyclase (GGDEF)-like protein/PAS domain S-box-containing protein